MNAHDAKAALLAHVLYRLHYHAAVTECGNGSFGVADVFGILKSGYTAEYEVKVTKADLAGELKSIRAIVEGQDLWADPSKKVTAAKYPKHNAYIAGAGYMRDYYKELEMRPNYFHFAVPYDLRDTALEALEGTPYGLYVLEHHENGGHPWTDVVCKKVAKRLHQQKAPDRLREQILHKACTELEVTRQALAKGRRCKEWSCRKELALRCPECDEREQRRRERNRQYRKESEEQWKKKQAEAEPCDNTNIWDKQSTTRKSGR